MLASICEEACERHGATVDRLNLAQAQLPVLSFDGYGAHQVVVDDVVARMKQANAFIIASPEYHGSVSGLMKNFFDHGYHEFAGKAFALLCSTGGSQGTSCMAHMREIIQYCHGWPLPYQAGASSADFAEDGTLSNAKIKARIEMMARDLVVYGRVLHDQFTKDLNDPVARPMSFTHWHGGLLK